MANQFQKRTMRGIIKLGLATALPPCLIIPTATSAQTAMFEGFLSTPGTGVIDTIRRNETLWEPLAKRNMPSPPRPLTPPVSKQANLAALRFSTDPQLRAALTKGFASTITNGETESPVGRFLIGGEAMAGMHRQMSAAGLSPTDVGDNMAFFIASQWSLARGASSQPSKLFLRAFSQQVGLMLAEQPEAASRSNHAKQRQSDNAMLFNAIMLRAREEAEGDPEATADIATSATKTLKNMGFDPQKFDLTLQGLVLVK